MNIKPYKKSHYVKMLEHLQNFNRMYSEYFAELDRLRVNKTKSEKENTK